MNRSTPAYLPLLATAILLSHTSAVALNETYTPSSEEVINPERGFFSYRELDLLNPSYSNYDTRSQGISLLYLKIRADDFKATAFSASALNAIEGAFINARASGIKLNPRIVYALSGGDSDAPLDIVLQHINQLSPIWHQYKDVLNVLDPGFVGAYGEWHSSTNNLDSEESRNAILNALLDALPVDRMLLVRRPDFKRIFLTGSSVISSNSNLTEQSAFDGSANARIGHLNDCFGSSISDLGTYIYNDRDTEIDDINTNAAYLPWGGETCGISTYNTCATTLDEMSRLHTNYINIDYHPDVINRWRSDGCFDTINNNLGYRFSLQSAQISNGMSTGQSAELSFNVENTGFGELFNPRPVELLFYSEGYSFRIPLNSIDPRFWKAGNTHDVQVSFTIPNSVPANDYAVYLSLPDASDALKLKPEYAIQFANENIWNETLGANLLFDNVTINIGSEVPETSELAIQNIQFNDSQLTINASYGTNTGHQLYIDTDNNTSTGFSISGIGADLLIESASLYRFSGINNTIWGWTFDSGITYISNDDEAEFIFNQQTGNTVSAVASLVGTTQFSDVFTHNIGSSAIPAENPVNASPKALDTGTPYQIQSTTSNACLDISGSSLNNGAALIEWPCTNLNNQRFSLKEVSDNVYSIHAQHSNKALQYHNGKSAFIQKTYNEGRQSQLFTIKQGNDSELENYTLCNIRYNTCIGNGDSYTFTK